MGVLDTEKEQEQDIDLFLVFERILLSVHFKAAKKDPKVPAALHSVLTVVGPNIGPERLHTFLSQFSFRGGMEVLGRWLDKKAREMGMDEVALQPWQPFTNMFLSHIHFLKYFFLLI